MVITIHTSLPYLLSFSVSGGDEIIKKSNVRKNVHAVHGKEKWIHTETYHRKSNEHPVLAYSSSFLYPILLFKHNAYEHNKNNIVRKMSNK